MAFNAIPMSPFFTKSFNSTRHFFMAHGTDANLVCLVAMVVECNPFSELDHIPGMGV
jgi:hypothetical protein